MFGPIILMNVINVWKLYVNQWLRNSYKESRTDLDYIEYNRNVKFYMEKSD